MRVKKDPQAVLDYGLDWSDWLVAGDTISSATWTITGPDGSLVQDSSFLDTPVVGVWLSGGTLGAKYSATCHITTSAGRQDDRTLIVSIENR